MIKKLQIKFVAIIMAIMTGLLLFIFGMVNITMFKTGEQQTVNRLREIAFHDGRLGKKDMKDVKDQGKPPFDGGMGPDSFSIRFGEEEEILEIVTERELQYTTEQIESLIAEVEQSGKSYGRQSGMQFLKIDRPYGSILVFLDNSMELNTTYRLLWTSAAIGSASMVAIFFLAVFLSRWAVKPVKEAFDAQKQFVADASHELKTPLTVIATNADVLGSEIGANKWLGFIQEEISRMSQLVNNLLYLAKNDSDEAAFTTGELDLSEAVMSVCLPFESVVFENKQTLTLKIDKGILVVGDENRLRQVAVILLDNAVKHAPAGGEIEVSLKMSMGKRVLTVFNTGDGISDSEKEKIFERFYRTDSSRARETGGYGLGLAIAKTIVERHNGKIMVENSKGIGVKFIVQI